mmetsp:Transcript_7173/g.10279  ORF Transcript_7173/g.10279 Transcript_7173/m.10279 type:complete len:561 (-) Transcript_7173:45-1727(-)
MFSYNWNTSKKSKPNNDRGKTAPTGNNKDEPTKAALVPKEVRERAGQISECREVMPANESSWSKISYASLTSYSSHSYGKDMIVAFIVDKSSSSSNTYSSKYTNAEEKNVARVNVYCRTGTVGICRVLNGEVREMFRPNCSLKAVESILRDPPMLINVIAKQFIDEEELRIKKLDDRHQVIVDESEDYDEESSESDEEEVNSDSDDDSSRLEDKYAPQHADSESYNSEYDAPIIAQLQLDGERVDAGIAIVTAEREDLKKHLKKLRGGDNKHSSDENLPTNHYTNSAKIDEKNILSTPTKSHNKGGGRRRKPSSLSPVGREYAFSLPTDTIDQVEEYLAQCNGNADVLMSVAINGTGSVFIYGSGACSYTSDIPAKLLTKFQERKRSRAPPQYVSLGTKGRYYIRFVDGGEYWDGPESLTFCLKDSKKQKRRVKGGGSVSRGLHNDDFDKYDKKYQVSSVAFGKDFDTFFIVYKDGSWEYEGEIPIGLEEILDDRQNRDDLVFVTLGSNGEWCLKAENRKMWWGGVSDEMDDCFDEISNEKKIMKFVDFGENDSYFMSYE